MCVALSLASQRRNLTLAPMFDDQDVHHVINPITALTYVISSDRVLLLAGEGPYLKVFDYATGQLLDVKRTFESQAIHGVLASERDKASDENPGNRLLIWGGRCIRTARLLEVLVDGQPEIKCEVNNELKADDWILDACFRPGSHPSGPRSCSKECNTVIVTAHNVALTIDDNGECAPNFRRVTVGPKSILYSACIKWTEERRILIASGTVFGEVLLWSFPERAVDADANLQVESQLHYRFTGHEGSIFGVSISPMLSHPELGIRQRLLASCSDDRTIRIWDISDLEPPDALCETESKPDNISMPSLDDVSKEDTTGRCVSTVMGHASRIWSIRFLASNNRVSIFSFGEDSTAQLWELIEKPTITAFSPTKGIRNLQLKHQRTLAFHTRKNIWVSATLEIREDLFNVCTGGADGRIVSYEVDQRGLNRDEPTLQTGWTMNDITEKLRGNLRGNEDRSEPADIMANDISCQDPLCKRIFNALEGTWTVKRDIRNALPTYPSGTFDGEANFIRRPASEDSFLAEYLYTENGTFTADQGLNFTASRQYVYRYKQASDTISAWFVKPDDHITVDYLFHELQIMKPTGFLEDENLQGESTVKAHGYHLCAEDHYVPEYSFQLRNGILQGWNLRYQVHGPEKDYVSEASYVTKADDHDQGTANSLGKTISKCRQAQDGQKFTPHKDQPVRDDFKSYAFLTNDSFLATTVLGTVLIGSIKPAVGERLEIQQADNQSSDVNWAVVGQVEALKSSSMTTRAESSEMIVIGGNDGSVFIYDSPKNQVRPLFKLSRKIAFLHAQGLDTGRRFVLATCLGLPVGYIYKYANSGSEKDPSPSLLDLPPSFIVTSASYIEAIDVWVLGSRNGALAFYDTFSLATDTASQPKNWLQSVHGEDAITVILILPEQKVRQPIHVLTAGRDGHYAIHTITADRSIPDQLEITFYTVHRSMPPFGPNIEGATFDPRSRDLLLWGFRSKHFVVWNASKDMETMNTECGGAHRQWSYLPHNNDSDGGTFVWTKASVCCLHAQPNASHRVLEPGGHGREIKAMAISPALNTMDSAAHRYVATGAEDTQLRIWSHNHSPESGFKCLATFKKHTTGILQLRWSEDARLLFSAAGCEEFFVWRVQPVPLIKIGVVCEAVCPVVSQDRDLRIMDFCIQELPSDDQAGRLTYLISIIYSDSSLRASPST